MLPEAGLVGTLVLQEAWGSLQGSHPAVVAADPGHQATEASRGEVEGAGFLDQLLLGMGVGRGVLDHLVL